MIKKILIGLLLAISISGCSVEDDVVRSMEYDRREKKIIATEFDYKGKRIACFRVETDVGLFVRQFKGCTALENNKGGK